MNESQVIFYTPLGKWSKENIIQKYWHKENEGLITLALFGDRERERELIKSGFGLGLDLTGGGWHGMMAT